MTRVYAGPFNAIQDDSGDRVGWWLSRGGGRETFVAPVDLVHLWRLVAKLQAHEAKQRRRRP